MTLPEAEQAVIRAAIDVGAAERKLANGGWEDVADLDLARRRLREAVDALLALRLADAGGERWRPKPGDAVRFRGSTVARKVVEYLPLSTGEMLVTAVIGRGSVYAAIEQIEPVPGQAKAEEPK